MKSLILNVSAAALTLFAAGSVPAAAHPSAWAPSAMTCEWQAPPQYGPRAPLLAPVCKTRGHERVKMPAMGGPECDPAYTGRTGRWVWRAAPQYGPRGPLQAPLRVWVQAC